MTISVISQSYAGGIVVTNVEGGLLVQQSGEGYLAKKWHLSPATDELIRTAISAGLGCMIRHNHPLRSSRWPTIKGAVYLAFSPSQDGQWAIAIDTFNPRHSDYGVAVFNGKYQAQFITAGLPFTFEGRNRGAGHLVVPRQHVLQTIRALATFDHSVLAMNRAPQNGEGFTTEYVLQNKVLTNWAETPWAERYDVVRSEYPVDGGMTSRRIDILARDRTSGDWLVIELKRAEASMAAVQQVLGYLLTLGKQDAFSGGRLDGAIVAERIPAAVLTAAESEGLAAYEAKWPFNLMRVQNS